MQVKLVNKYMQLSADAEQLARGVCVLESSSI